MEQFEESKIKKALDNILIYNLFILIFGSILLAVSFLLSTKGNSYLFTLFQKLWFPVFIPSLSLFFTAILVEATLNWLKNGNRK
tara:strand:+ start:366 stop:617 length:252 start_codon:yes stop_codon:yes gene_type:complete